MGIMEKKMETTKDYSILGYTIGVNVNMGIMEKKMENYRDYRGYIGVIHPISPIVGFGVRVSCLGV